MGIQDRANLLARGAQALRTDERSGWWQERRAHDDQLRLLLEKVESEWFGGLKVRALPSLHRSSHSERGTD